MLYSSFWKALKHSSNVSLVVAVIGSISISVIISFFYLYKTDIPVNPSYAGLAVVHSVNGVESQVTFNGSILTMEVINSSEGDTVSVYTYDGLYTNNPSGHSLSTGGTPRILAIFIILGLLGAIAGFFLGFLVVVFLQKNK